MNYFDEIREIVKQLGIEEGNQCQGCPREKERSCANIECLEEMRRRKDESNISNCLAEIMGGTE